MSKWQFYLTVEDAWKAMLEACKEAKSTIDFEQFIFENDEIGRQFVEVFIAKAKEGVKVRVLIDTAGSYGFILSGLARQLTKGGVELRYFNKISPWKVTRLPIWFFRDHRKVLVIDREVGFTGGVGIGYKMRTWRDTHFRIEGDVVYQLQEAFDHMWWITGHERFIRFKECRQTPDGFKVITNAPHFRQRYIHRTFLEIIRSAKRYVYITTPYFVPDVRFSRVLRLAAKRGVDVRILIPEYSDHPLVDFASNYHFRNAFKSGIRIFKYNHPMLHAKTLVTDDEWVSVGSSNIDNYSSFFNYELNVTSVDRKFVSEVRNQFFVDLKNATEIDPQDWKKRSVFRKVLETIFAPFGRFF